jgi:hypothetical protein
MKRIKYAICVFIGCCLFLQAASAQKLNLPKGNLKVLVPVLEVQSFETNSEMVDGKLVNLFVFGINNWDVFSDNLFAAAPDLPPCGSNKNSARTWLTIYDFQTKKQFNGNCAFTKSEDMKTFKFNIIRKDIPKCVYITLTDRKNNKVYQSNPVRLVGKEKCEVDKP